MGSRGFAFERLLQTAIGAAVMYLQQLVSADGDHSCRGRQVGTCPVTRLNEESR